MQLDRDVKEELCQIAVRFATGHCGMTPLPDRNVDEEPSYSARSRTVFIHCFVQCYWMTAAGLQFRDHGVRDRVLER